MSKLYLFFFSNIFAFLLIMSCNDVDLQDKNRNTTIGKEVLKIYSKCKFCKFKSSNNNTVLQGAYYRENDTIFFIPVTKIAQIIPPKVFSRLLHYPILPINSSDKKEFELNGKTSDNKRLLLDKYYCRILDISICESKEAVLDTIYIFENYIDIIEFVKINGGVPSIENTYSDTRLSVVKAVYIYSTLRGMIHFDYLQDREPILPYLPYIKHNS